MAPHLRHLCEYLGENRLIESLRDVDPQCLQIYSRDVLAKIRAGDPSWEAMTPPAVADLITSRGLLGYRAGTDASRAA